MHTIPQRISSLLAWVAVAFSAGAFTVWGPAETWQTPDLNYVDRTLIYGEGELGGPKTLGAGARLNVPVLTYAFDATFLEFFGEEGVHAIDSAMAMLNALPRASAANVNAFLTDGAQQINYTAQALSLFDLKSETLGLLLEHEGLLGETHVYDLRSRTPQPGVTIPCQFYYYVILRNYDPVTYNPTPYVNGVLYGYNIVELCPAGDQVADAVEYPVDAARPSGSFTAVATKEGLLAGGYYVGLTRDDIGGLRWLYRQSHLANETIDPNSFVTGVGSSPYNFFGNGFLTSNTLATTVFGGVEKVRYVKVQFDSLLGGTFTPVSYNYSLPAVVNNQLTTVRLTRTIFAPDIVFAGADLIDNAFSPPHDEGENRTVAFSPSPVTSTGNGVNGPGVEPSVIQPPTIITFNTANPIFFNGQPTFLSDENILSYPVFQWGSFDGSGNAPVVYPNGTSLLAAEQAALVPPSNTSFPGTFDLFDFTAGINPGAVTFLGNY